MLLGVVIYGVAFSSWNTNISVMGAWIAISMCTFGVLGCAYPNNMLVIMTSLIGSLYVAFGLSILTGHTFLGRFHWTMILFIMVAVGLLFLGIFVQRKLGFHKFELDSEKEKNIVYIPIAMPG